MMKTNLTPSPRLKGRGCCCFTDFLWHNTTLILLILMLPLSGMAQEKFSDSYLKEKEARHQQYLQSIYGNKPETVQNQAAKTTQLQAVSETQKRQLLEEQQEAALREKIQNAGYDVQKYIDAGYTMSQILEEIDTRNTAPDIKTNASGYYARVSGGSDLCQDAELLACDTPSFGDTFGATNSGNPICSGFTNGEGVWYTFTGNGANNTISITSSTFTTQINVYSSGNGTCDALQCAGASGQGSSTVNVFTAYEEQYWVFVTGLGNTEGTFTIERTSSGECIDGPAGDGLAPESAFEIACGDVAEGDSTGFPPASSTEHLSASACNPLFTSNLSAPAVWYTFTATAGTPEDITLTTCGYDTSLVVYAGTPGSLTCVGGSGDATTTFCTTNSFESQVSFTAQIDQTYYIKLWGYDSTEYGPYQLQMVCDGDAVTPPPSAPNNDLCPDAIPLICGETQQGTNVAATDADEPASDCGNGISGVGVWYSFEGVGDDVIINTCGFDTELHVLSGVCGALTCVVSNDQFSVPGCTTSGESQVTFNAADGELYYIYVTGWNGVEGEFDITITCPEPLENDDCDGAIVVDCDSTTDGNMLGASTSTAPFCELSGFGPGVWYQFAGTGNIVDFDTNGSSFDTRLYVYSGACGSLVCEEYDDDGGDSTQSLISMNTVAGVDYFIHVTAYSSTTPLGAFVLNVTCPPDPCETATQISCADTQVFGNNSGANGSTITPGLCEYDGTVPGVMYEFVADPTEGKLVTINTCGSNFDTRLNVYSGECGALSCLASNDDWSESFAECGTSLRSRVAFFAEAGESYYIWVNGYGSGTTGATGDFVLNIECVAPVGNDLCDAAIALGCGSSLEGSTNLSSDRDAPTVDCSELDQTIGAGVWYTVAGTGGDVEISVCDTDFDAKMLIFTGDCEGGLTCYDGSDQGSGCGVSDNPTAVIPTELGTTYTIYVTGNVGTFTGTEIGNFTISVNCLCYNPNEGVIDCYTIYQGYDDPNYNSVTLETDFQYGTPPYTYEWSHDATETGSSVVISAPDDVAGITSKNYVATMTDATGCTSTQEWFVQVVDVDCDRGGSEKVELCHNGLTICVSENAVAQHIQHGDILGACNTALCDEVTPICDVVVTSPADGAIHVDLDTTIEWEAATGIVDNYNVSIVANGVEVLNQDVGTALSLDVSLVDVDVVHTVTITPSNTNGDALGCQAQTSFTTKDPSVVVCGEVANFTYCYTAFDDNSFFHQSSDGGPLTLEFNQGYIERSQWDQLVIYEGTDATGAILWQNPNTTISDLDGTIVTAASGQIFITINSDSSAQCDGSSFNEPWDYDVYCGAPEAQYCDSEFTSGCCEWITGFELNTINNPSGFEGYGDFTALSTDLTAGATYSFTINAEVDSSEGYAIWIDYNQDFDFDDAGEQVFLQGTTNNTTITGSFTVPTTALSGPTRLRVMQDWQGIVDPCIITSFGETEDYTVNILGAARPTNINQVANTGKLDWSLSPNPTRGNVNLDLTNYLRNTVTVEVVDFTGKLITTRQLDNLQSARYTLELSNSLPEGMYFVRVSSGKQTSAKKLVIMR